MTQMNGSIKQADAEKILEQLVAGMENVFEKMKPELREIEEKLLVGMTTFGASEYDVEQVRVWLRPMIESEVKRIIYDKVIKSL